MPTSLASLRLPLPLSLCPLTLCGCLSLWMVASASAVDVPLGTPATFDGSFSGAEALVFADLDGDGDPDALAGGAGELAVWLNDGSASTWTKTSVDTGVTTPASIVAADLDGDGDVDFAAADSGANTLSWYENTAGDASTWTRTDVATTETGVRSVVAADLDGDGDLDLLSAAEDLERVVWWSYDAATGFSTTPQVIASSLGAARSVYPMDMDRDGDVDVLATAGTSLLWFENSSAGTAWTSRSIDATLNAPNVAMAHDFDGDSDLDVVLSDGGGDTVYAFENQGSGTWVRVDIASADGPHSLGLVDLDADGDGDLVGSATDDDAVFWLEHPNAPWTDDWTFRDIQTSAGGARQVATADLDRDGDLDIAAALLTDGDLR